MLEKGMMMEPLTRRDTFESSHVFILLSVRNTLIMVPPLTCEKNVQYGDLLQERFPRECWWIPNIENDCDRGSNISSTACIHSMLLRSIFISTRVRDYQVVAMDENPNMAL